MLKIENTEVMGWEAAIRGMRNPMNSWEKSDSGFCQRDLLRDCTTCVHKDTGYDACRGRFDVGQNDYDLMTRLRNAGTDHRKFMRMIAVYVDITAPLYWWKEFDTYKVGTVANSCSTMHKIADKEFTVDDFSHEHLTGETDGLWVNADGKDFMCSALDFCQITCDVLNHYRALYLQTKDKKYWWQMIQLLPSSYNQRRTVMLNYEVLVNIYKSRRNHKLDEWHTFCDWIEGLPYSELITSKQAVRNNSYLLNGGDSVGMTDNQYKGMLLDQLEDWQEILELAIAAGNTEIQKKVEKQIAKTNEKLKF